MELSSSIKLQATILEDVIIKFLLRLPVKTLLRFKLVCKTWYNLIKSRTFKLMHHNFGTVSQLLTIAKKRSNQVFRFGSDDKLTCELSPDLQVPANPDSNVFLAGSCNGIVCYYDCTSTIFLSNPATRKFRQLPSTISFQFGGTDEFLLQHIGVGFGFESSNIYDFKVLRLLCLGGTHTEIRAEMFTLSSNTWRQLDCGLNNELVFRGVGVFCANSFHFMMQGDKHSFLKQLLVCCDIGTERFKTMDFPPKPNNDDGSFTKLMAFKECLSSVYTYPWMKYEEKPIEIWVMKDYGVVESWTKLYTIGPPSALPLCFRMDQDDLLLVQFKTDKLVSCHLSTLHVESVKIFGYQLYSRIVTYKETFVSII